MKNLVLVFLVLYIGLFNNEINAQCIDIPVADFSFEEGTFQPTNDMATTGFWYRTDGAEISGSFSYEGDSSICSFSGGPRQFIAVDPNTTYHLSCFVKNGLDDYSLSFVINQIHQSTIAVNSNDWTFISQSFNSEGDTLVNIGVYSDAACFDNFRLTCDSIIANVTNEPIAPQFTIYPTISATNFTLETANFENIEIYDLGGQLIKKATISNNIFQFGNDFPPGIYFVLLFLGDKFWSTKIIKE